jgi:hypothetical protein
MCRKNNKGYGWKNWRWRLDIAMIGIGAFLLWKSVDFGEAYANHWLRKSGGPADN